MDIKVMHKLAEQLFNEDTSTQVLDARSKERYNGEVAEPRAGVRSGCIKNSLNVPFNCLVNAEDGTLKSDEELSQILKDIGVDFSKPIVNTCGSGVTACVINLSLNILGTPSKVYDGSWSEYGSIDEPKF
jgi:thiosulfate/3-mercaptopyruvate sulfurtransferase